MINWCYFQLTDILYFFCANRIGNEMDMTLVELNDLLPSASVMVVRCEIRHAVFFPP